MKISGIVKAIRFILAYGALVMVVIEIAEFAIDKLENVKLPKREKVVEDLKEVQKSANDGE